MIQRLVLLVCGILSFSAMAMAKEVELKPGRLDSVRVPSPRMYEAEKPLVFGPASGNLLVAHAVDVSFCASKLAEEGGFQGNEGLCGVIPVREALKLIQDYVQMLDCSSTEEGGVQYSVDHVSLGTSDAPVVYVATNEVTCNESPFLHFKSLGDSKSSNPLKECVDQNCRLIFKNKASGRHILFSAKSLIPK